MQRRKVAAEARPDPRQALRRAQRDVADAEAAVAALEAKVSEVVAKLEDPALYTRPDGAASARKLGAELDGLKRELDAALQRWTEATTHAETLSG